MKKTTLIAIISIVLIGVSTLSVFAIGYSQKWDWLPFVNQLKDIQNDKTVIVTVNGEEIYASQIESQIAFSELSHSIAVTQVENMNIPEEEKQELLKQQQNSQNTREEILNNLIRQTVVLQDAKRREITVSDDEVKTYVLDQYALFKDSASKNETNQSNYDFIKTYMEENGLTEEQYLDQVTSVYKKMFIQNKFYEVIASEKGDENINEYVDTLVEQAEIIYAK